ncbi:MAG: LON peptidase substrate-binding domain-containing protein, partial [Candidatus Shikimatogenerans sp. JK-2022]|nr:LON peptidase substrate-binding domain-containing protein [Candidatus Shikimatogenerans bostrichidophilus]
MSKNNKKILFLSNGSVKKISLNKNIPFASYILLTNDYIIYPGLILPINIIDKKLLYIFYKKIYKNNRYISFFSKKNFFKKNIKYNIFNIGILSKIVKIYSTNKSYSTIVLKGLFLCTYKTKIENYYKNIIFKSKVLPIYEKKEDKNTEIYLETIKTKSIEYFINKNFYPIQIINNLKNINNIYLLIYYLFLNINIDKYYKYKILKINNLKKKTFLILKYLDFEIEKNNLSLNILKKVKKDINKQQKEYFLNQQIKAIQEKLGYNNINPDINNIEKKSKNKKWSKEAQKKFKDELSKLKNIHPNMPEYILIKNYLNFLLNLPWYKYSKDNLNFKKAILIFNKYHYGLVEIKERILEYLAVLKLNKFKKAPILCFVGPPGVGKTSLGKTISKVLSRK